MPPIRRILVAVKDPRRKSFPALAKAADLARALEAKLELFHAIAQPVAFDALTGKGLQQHLKTLRDRNLRQLERMAEPLRRRGIDVSTATEWDYPSHEALVRRTQTARADLIIAGRHAGRTVARWLMRYTDWELLRQSPVPVLLVRKGGGYRAPAILAAVDPSHAFEKSAQLDQSILGIGAQIGEASRGKLHVMHSYVPGLDGIDQEELSAGNASQLITERAAEQAGKRLDATLRAAGLRDLPARRRHLVPLHPVNSIPQLARELGCDIVVMGAISRSGIKGLVIGNTAERLMDEITCDVLVVKPRGFKTRVAPRTRGPELYFSAPPSTLP